MRSDARKRLTEPAHTLHHDPAVCALIAEAEERGRREASEAIFELAKRRAVRRGQKTVGHPLVWTVTIADFPRLIRDALTP